MKKVFLIVAALNCFAMHAQLPNFDHKAIKTALQTHVGTLASDKFEGRETGTKGEQLAADYIVSQFRAIGLQTKGASDYIQKFSFQDGVKFEANENKLMLDRTPLALNSNFFPLPYSANAKISGTPKYLGHGIVSTELALDDYKDKADLKGKVFIMEYHLPVSEKDSTSLNKYPDIRTRIETAISKGATAIVFINSDNTKDDPKINQSEAAKTSPLSVPVLFVKGNQGQTLKQEKVKTLVLETKIVKTERNGQNVIGFLDNKSLNTIIIGAHFDHLGMGHEETSLHKGPPAIHNGADDNASGTAAVIEMAKYLSANGPKNNNYLFICFSGEELGLMGSNYYSKNPTVDLQRTNYMINMDMIGRLKRNEKTLAVYGTGTSPLWNKLLPEIKVDSIQIKTIESGIGPSDHTSFYLKDIPVLHFFSGFHPDYHKPSDDIEKINFEGEVSILKYILTIVQLTDTKGRIEFTKTKEEPVSSKNTSKPRVTLGVVPDYMYSNGDGMRIDGVSEGKPAAEAGLKAGDLIMQVGNHKVTDMQSYMKALSGFSKSDGTKVKFKRGSEIIEADVNFGGTKPSELSEKNYRVYSTRLKQEVSIDSVISEMKDSDVLFYGEEHNDSVTHYLEKTVFEKLNSRFGDKLALSMEMFDRDVQPVMDEYLKDYIREKNFKKDARVWSNYRDYRPMVELAKSKHLDVVCANGPSRYANLAGRKGQGILKELSPESKRFFAPLPYDTAQGKYYDKLLEMSGHSPAGKTDTAKVKAPPMGMGAFNLIVSQSLWDATMAYSIAEYLKKNKGKKVFQVNGRFHSDQGFAIVSQLKKYNSKLKPLIISSGSDPAFPNIDWSKYTENGDYIIITDPAVPKTYQQ
jgi:aminopeptidase YwaD